MLPDFRTLGDITRLTGDLLIAGQSRPGLAQRFHAIDPRTGHTLEPAFGGADEDDLNHACQAAGDAFALYRRTPPSVRSALLEAIATGMDHFAPAITARAVQETGLPQPRIENESRRTIAQLRLFASLVRQGDWLDARINHAQPDRHPLPRPDLRQQRMPLGPVAVFGASNFPLAFSVAGGDTAAALAAGAPVVVKAHPAHPGTSELVGKIVQRCVDSLDLPGGTFSLLFGDGHSIGASLVANPHIKAIAFTGSRSGGLALMQVAAARPVPIPVFAEMSSINPVFLLSAALRERGSEIAEGFVASMSLSAGQFCTHPGLLIAVDDPDLNRFLDAVHARLATVSAQTMLTTGIHQAFERGVDQMHSAEGVTLIASGALVATQEPPSSVPATNRCRAQLFSVSAERFLDNPALTDEVFGACTLVVRCHSFEQMAQIARRLDGQLTATLHFTDTEIALAESLVSELETRAGRIVCNGFPTGVEVCDAMVHGGPFPATSDGRSTSVGTAAIERFLRPVCYQNIPDALLPTALQRGNPLQLNRLED